MDLPDLIQCEQCVGVEEGVVWDVVATQIEQPWKSKIYTTTDCQQQQHLPHSLTSSAGSNLSQDMLLTSNICVRGFFCVPVIENRLANSEIRSQGRSEAQQSSGVGYKKDAFL